MYTFCKVAVLKSICSLIKDIPVHFIYKKLINISKNFRQNHLSTAYIIITFVTDANNLVVIEKKIIY